MQSQHQHLRVGKADKGLGPVIASEILRIDALKRTLYYYANLYKELVGVTTNCILNKMDADFIATTAKFQTIEIFEGLFYTLRKWQNNCLLQPHLRSIYLLWKVHKPGRQTRAIVPNKVTTLANGTNAGRASTTCCNV